MKKMLLGSFLGMFALAGVAVLPNITHADDPATPAATSNSWANPGADTNMINGSQKTTGAAFLDTLKNAVNWLMGILATVALVFCLYGGFLMVTSAGDEKKYSSGLNVLKYAGIGLAIIGLSWMIVSVIVWFVGTLGGNNQTKSADVTATVNTTSAGDSRTTANS